MAASFSPSYVQGGSWSSSGGTVSTNYGRLAINSVSLDTSTGKININYTLSIRKSDTSTAGYNLARIQGWINGESIGNYQGAEYNWYDSSWYNGSVDHKDYKTGTYALTWNGSSSQSVTIAVRSLQDWGYTDSRWGQDNLCSRGSTTLTISGLITNPTIDSTSVTSNANGALTYSYTSTAGTGTINGQTWTFKNSGGTTLATKTDASGTVTGLGNNNNITWSLAITASDGGSASTSGSVYTRHSAPTIGTVSVSVGTRTSGTYGGTISYPVTYDNAGYSSHTFKYGTSSSSLTNNATSSGTGSTASWTISGLEPNKTYYYSAVEVDNGGNESRTSSAKTGSFTTTGIAPTISNVSVTPGETSGAFSWSASADTNASISSRRIDYGTTSSYGDYVTPTGNSYTLTSLAGATKYYYKITVVDNKGRSTTSTGNFTTLSYAPRNISVWAEEITSTSIKVGWSYDVPAGAAATAVTLYIKENGQTERTVSVTGSNYTVSNLAVDNNVSFALGVTNAQGTTKSNYINLSTVLNAPTLTVDGNAISPFEIQVVASASITPTRSLLYKFSKDGGTTWSSYQTSAVYTWTNLTEETTYHVVVGVKAVHTATYSGDIEVFNYQDITTPADQATVRLKKEGSWVQGKAWIKVGGVWKKAKKVYVKKNGEWVLNKNG